MSSPYQTFISKLPAYTKYNYYLLTLSTLQLLLISSVLPSQLLCRQGLPLAIFNIIAQSLTLLLPIFCILACRALKYFNTVLAYTVLVLVMKIVQIVALCLFGHVGACTMLALYRVPVVVYLVVQFVCFGVDGWILKRVRRVDRENKAVGLFRNKAFLSD